MKVGFFTFEQYHNKKNIGSSRIRAEWVYKHWKDAEKYKLGKKYDAIIFQKVYMIEFCELYEGIKILDLCDPDWLELKPVVKMASLCDAITTSSEKIAEDVKKWVKCPVVCIPDRVDLDINKQKKIHKGRAKSIVWFGYSHNSHTLKQVVPYIKAQGLKLKVISERKDATYESLKNKYGDTISWKKWNANTINDDLIKHDFCIIPPSPKFKDLYKSNNKTVHCWSIGLPVAKTNDELKRFVDPNERDKEAEKRLKEVKEKYDVKLSVKEYKELIDEISNK